MYIDMYMLKKDQKSLAKGRSIQLTVWKNWLTSYSEANITVAHLRHQNILIYTKYSDTYLQVKSKTKLEHNADYSFVLGTGRNFVSIKAIGKMHKTKWWKFIYLNHPTNLLIPGQYTLGK